VRNVPNIHSTIERLRVIKEQVDSGDLASNSHERLLIASVLAHLVTAVENS